MPHDSHTHRILVVDDDPVNLVLARIVLGAAGYQVDTAPSGEAALAQAIAAPPDAILSDIQMPGMDGVQLRHSIQSHASVAGIPVILISSALEEERARRRNHDLDTGCVPRTPELQEAIDALAAALNGRNL